MASKLHKARDKGSMKDFLTLLRHVNVKLRIFLVPLFFAIISAAFDGVSVGMFVPILKGVIDGNFGFLYDSQYFNLINSYVPIFGNEKSVIRPLLFLFGIYLLLFLGKIYTSWLAKCSAAKVAFIIADIIRRESFSRCLTLGKSFFDTSSKGQFHTTITKFSSELGWGFVSLTSYLAQVLPIVFYFSLMLILSWKAALLSLCLAPAAFLLKPIYRKLSGFSTTLASSDKELNQNLDRVLQGIATVKANSGEDAEIMRFEKVSETVRSNGTRLALRVYTGHLMTKLLMITIFSAVGGIMLLILSEDIRANASTYLIYLVVTKKAVDILQLLGFFHGELEALRGLIRSINELFSLDLSRYRLSDGNVDFKGVRERIEVKNVSFDYLGGTEVLHDINFTINRGEAVALVGPSGSGKSTIAQLLLRLYDVTHGAILIDGVEIRDFRLQTLRERTAFVSQSTNLFDDSLRRNILYGMDREVSDEEVVSALKQASLGAFYEQLPDGLDTRIGERGVRISGGEAQRVAIARAILKGVDFFILDEATSALDAQTEKLIQEAIDCLVKDKTVLIIAHRFSTLKNVDKILTIENGRVVEEGALDELLGRKGLFAKLWKAQELFV